jgi:hypothetical protein
MGWDFGYETLDELKKRICEGDGFKKPVAYSKRSNKVWTVHLLENGDHYITVWLLRSRASEGMSGYKDIGEEMGPYEKDCPVGWLDKYQTTHKGSLEWRDNARAYHARKSEITKRKVAPGVRFFHGPSKVEFTVVEPYHMRGWWVVRDLIGRLTRSRTGTIQRCMGGEA